MPESAFYGGSTTRSSGGVVWRPHNLDQLISTNYLVLDDILCVVFFLLSYSRFCVIEFIYSNKLKAHQTTMTYWMRTREMSCLEEVTSMALVLKWHDIIFLLLF